MAKGTPPVDEERLPWLEPYRDAIAKTPPTKPRANRRGSGLVVGGVAAIAAALTAGYYIGQREQASPPTTTRVAEAPVTIAPVTTAPVTPPEPAPSASAASPPASAAPVNIQPPPPAVRVPAPARAAASTRSKPNRQAARKRALRNLANERNRLRQIRLARARAAAASRPTPRMARQNMRNWPKMPSPGPAGQVVQLGAFRTEGRALAAYRSRLSRYPVLGSMPRVVVPVITKPRGQVLYVLRVGTSSRQQSRVVCRNLKASGDHCLVIG